VASLTSFVPASHRGKSVPPKLRWSEGGRQRQYERVSSALNVG
jgi:hypothetical protein